MRLLDSRRLFGPSLETEGPSALAEVALEDGEDAEVALARWAAAVREILPDAALHVRRSRAEVALAIAGPLDELLPLTDVNEWAVARASGAPVVATPAELRAALGAAREPALRALLTAARARGLPVLVDDSFVSVGLGARAAVFPRTAPELPDWAQVGTIPVVLVTGTNGKTTSARLLARIAAEAGHTVGLATTDGVHVGGALVAAGDFTGPDAARLILRRPEVTLAVLETARGGILRRGLAVDRCDVALLTNVSDDHLGLCGVDDVATMARVKAVVGQAATRAVVLNGDDPALAGQRFGAPVVRFTRGAEGAEWTVAEGALVGRGLALLPIAELPIALGGIAGHNVANALGAAAAADALGLPWDALRRGLGGFAPADNPGRGGLWRVGGAELLLDFGHNLAAVRALLDAARARTGRELLVVTGLPGDRSDEALRAIARRIAAARPARVLLHDLADYLRGRAPGAVPALLADELVRAGLEPAAIERTAGERDGVERALAAARPGALVAVFPHLDRAGVEELLAERGATQV